MRSYWNGRQICGLGLALVLSAGVTLAGAEPDGVGAPAAPAAAKAPAAPPAAAAARVPVTVASDYVIGPEDQLGVVFFQNAEASTDVIVRPDGKISLPLLNEIQASGLTPEQLRGKISEQAKRYFQDPNPVVMVKQINSRKVFITGWVEKPGTYPLLGTTTVLQLIATAGGLKPDADAKKIVIIRNDGTRRTTYRFNYKDVVNESNMDQNIDLKPGDTVVVP